MEFVVNEWLPEYFRPEATIEEKKQLEQFIIRFYERNDKIFVRKPSEFSRKIFRYAKDYQTNNKVYTPLYRFIVLILEDPNRCVFINDENLTALPIQTITKLQKGNYASDTYLFEAATKAESRIIVTTDEKLINHMKDDTNFNVVLLSGFLRDY